MPHVQLRDIRLYFEQTGDPTARPLLLIAGLGAQLTSWYPDFVNLVAQAGFRVITYDNRDAGLSTKCDADPDYEINDMADDAAALLDGLGLDSAHVVGQSMGGMIAQQLAISHPHKVASLVSIYSAPSPNYVTNDPQIWQVRNQTPANNREAWIQQYIDSERISGLAEFSEEWIRAYAEATIDRCYCPAGGDRQMASIQRSGDRTADLATLQMPTAVIHGLNDRLIGLAGGLATAASVSNAELHVYADMGHQLLPSLWPDLVRVIIRTAERAETLGRSGAADRDCRDSVST